MRNSEASEAEKSKQREIIHQLSITKTPCSAVVLVNVLRELARVRFFKDQRNNVLLSIKKNDGSTVEGIYRGQHGKSREGGYRYTLESDIGTSQDVGVKDIDEVMELKIDQVIEVDPRAVSQFLGLLFVDLASSTDLTNLLGDSTALVLMQRYREIVRNALVDHGGREIDRAGDGFLTSFESASAAVSCAITIQKALAADNANREGPVGLHVRIGIGAGEPVMDGKALFGSIVNLTARICAQAEPDQILTSRVVRELCLGKGLSFSPLGAQELKGFEDPVELVLVSWD